MNPWKLGVIVVLSALAVLCLVATGYGAAKGYEAYSFLNAPVGTFGDKPLTRAGFLELQLAREAQASKPAEAPPGATK